MRGLFRLQAPVAVVDAATVMSHLRVSDAGEQTIIESYRDAATRMCEQHTGYAIGQQRWRLSLPAFSGSSIRIPLPPLVSVQSVKYYDLNGVIQTVDTSAYYVDPNRLLGEVTIKPGMSWPVVLGRSDAVMIDFTCGNASVDADMVAAILLLTGHLYENREAVTGFTLSELPWGVESLLSPYKVPVCA